MFGYPRLCHAFQQKIIKFIILFEDTVAERTMQVRLHINCIYFFFAVRAEHLKFACGGIHFEKRQLAAWNVLSHNKLSMISGHLWQFRRSGTMPLPTNCKLQYKELCSPNCEQDKSPELFCRAQQSPPSRNTASSAELNRKSQILRPARHCLSAPRDWKDNST